MKVISLGVGVQSTALYYMSSMGIIDRADVAIFADTGAEKSATMEYFEHLVKWQKDNNGIPLHKTTYKNIQTDILKGENSTNNRFASIPAFTESGGMLKRQCTKEYKIQPVQKKIKELYGLTGRQRFPLTDIWYGITADEITRIAKPWRKWYINVYPLVGYKVFYNGQSVKISDTFYRRHDIQRLYAELGQPIPVRSSCVFCPFQSDANWTQNSKEDFDIAVKVDKTIRNVTKKGANDKIYLHRSLKPINEVNFYTGAPDLFEECSANCML